MSGQLQQVACPHCGCSVNNDASFAGRSVVCPACRGRFQMPPLLPVAQPIPPVTHEVPAPPLTANSSYKPLQSRPRPRLSSLALKSVLLAVPGLCCFPLGLVGIVLGITAYFRINDKRNNEYGLPFALTGVGLGIGSLLILAVALARLEPRTVALARLESRTPVRYQQPVASSSETDSAPEPASDPKSDREIGVYRACNDAARYYQEIVAGRSSFSYSEEFVRALFKSYGEEFSQSGDMKTVVYRNPCGCPGAVVTITYLHIDGEYHVYSKAQTGVLNR